MSLAFVVATRSEDPNTKHGAVIVENGTDHIIGTGFNGLVRGLDPKSVDLTRPAKYTWMIHSEENAIQNCTKHPLSLPKGARVYITGKPCVSCIQRLVNFGIKEIIIAEGYGWTKDAEEKENWDHFVSIMKPSIRTMKMNGPCTENTSEDRNSSSCASLCEHANEVPRICECPEDCHCRVVGNCEELG